MSNSSKLNKLASSTPKNFPCRMIPEFSDQKREKRGNFLEYQKLVQLEEVGNEETCLQDKAKQIGIMKIYLIEMCFWELVTQLQVQTDYFEIQQQIERKFQREIMSSDSEFMPNYQQTFRPDPIDKKIKKKKLLRKQAAIQRCENYCEGAWSAEENLVYLDFLVFNKPDFVSEHLRRSKRVFYRLSQLLPNRTPEQCRSHHQKIQQQSHSEIIEDIIDFTRQRYLKKFQIQKSRTSDEFYTRFMETGYFCELWQEQQIRISLNIESIEEI